MKKKIVVVERDRDILQVIHAILTGHDYRVFGMDTEHGALQKIIEVQPHAILLDIIKPSVEGTKLCKALKASPGTRDIPIIVLSTHSQIDSVKDTCADDIVPKPFDIDDLLQAVGKQVLC